MKKVTKNIFKACAILLLAAGAAMPMTAAEPAAQQPITYQGGQVIEVGDTVRIHKDQHYYLTGERMSSWVYKKQHIVRQVGGKRYPQGILLKGIYSWVFPQSVYPITPKAPKTVSISVTACGQYKWDVTGEVYTTSGEYTYKTKAVNGCDSTVVLNLTIKPVSEDDAINVTACSSYYWSATKTTYTKSGTYTYTTVAANGCDSIVTLQLNVVQPEHKDTNIVILPRQLPYTWHGIEMKNIGDTSRVCGKTEEGCNIYEHLHLNFKAQKRWGKDITPVVPGWTPNLPYHIEGFTFGLRGGFASNLAGEKLPLGAGAALDFGYTHYWVAGAEKNAYGFKTGLNLGYVYTTQHKESILDNYTVDVLGENLDYTISLDKVAQQTHQLQLEIPLMFAMQTTKGFFLNAGPKLILPVMSKYHQTLTNPSISVTGYPELPGVPVVNEEVTGKVPSDKLDYTDNFLVSNPCKLFSLALGAELGYNFKLKKYGQSIDLGVYADYSIINAYKNTAAPTGKVITVTPPTNTSAAIVDVQSLSTAFSNKFGYMNFGVKVAFNFNTAYYFN